MHPVTWHVKGGLQKVTFIAYENLPAMIFLAPKFACSEVTVNYTRIESLCVHKTCQPFFPLALIFFRVETYSQT